MFGYIVVDKEKISSRDYRLFTSFYCGLCLKFKRRYGNKYRIFNNFDSAFAFILLASYQSLPISIQNKNCIIHPFKKRPMLELEEFDNNNLKKEQIEGLQCLSTMAEQITDVTMLLVKGKMYDDILDNERGANFRWKRFKKTFDYASEKMPIFNDIVMKNTKKTAELEESEHPNIEKLAQLSGEIIAHIPICILNIKKNNPLYELFLEIGKWIYYVDAINDLEKDSKKKSFNAFISMFGNYIKRQEFIAKNKGEILKYLNMCLENIKKIYKKLSSSTPNTLIENVLLYAMEKQQKAILINPNKKLII